MEDIVSVQAIRLDLWWGPAVQGEASSKGSIRKNIYWAHTCWAWASPPTPHFRLPPKGW